MYSRLLRYLALALPFAFTQSDALAAAHDGAAADIRAAYGVWSRGMQQGDASLVMSVFDEEAVWCAQDGRCFSGRAAIETMNRERFQKNGAMRSAEPKTTKLAEDGDFIHEWGNTRIVSATGEIRVVHYLAVWRRQQDGAWKIFRDILLPS